MPKAHKSTKCKPAQPGGDPSWQFREPVAALFQQGKTVGVHYAGPTWEIEDSLIVAKVTASVPSPNGKDIPWLNLQVTTEAEAGPLLDVTAVQRINTAGGLLEGPCETAGELRPTAYGADYVFLRKSSLPWTAHRRVNRADLATVAVAVSGTRNRPAC